VTVNSRSPSWNKQGSLNNAASLEVTQFRAKAFAGVQRVVQAIAMAILLEDVNRPATWHLIRNKLTQVVRIRFRVKKSIAQEGDELTKLVSRQ
jgi:hypothetical protein